MPLILRAESLRDVHTSEFATMLGFGAGDWRKNPSTRPHPLGPSPKPLATKSRSRPSLTPGTSLSGLPRANSTQFS
jgi:hypothetical protein